MKSNTQTLTEGPLAKQILLVSLPLATAFLQVQTTLYRAKTSLKPAMSQLSENYDRAV